MKNKEVIGIGVMKSMVRGIHGLDDKESEDLDKFIRKAGRDPEIAIKKAISSSNLNNKQIAAVGFIAGYALGSFFALRNVEEQRQMQTSTEPSNTEVV